MTKSTSAFLLALLLAACAQVKEPQGGPKDTVPPRLLSAEPADGSTRFTGKRIVLHFDERVKLDRVREKLLVSPPLAEAPEVTVSGGKDVVIDLNAPLAVNTTYTFNIGEAVQDLSEGNPAAGLSFVVSTGDHVDSLSVNGRVLDAFSGLPAPDVLVLLHDEKDTGDVRTAPPAYFTRTAADGSFLLAHLRSGRMRLNALQDRNANFRFDLPNEQIAFLDSVINPRDSTKLELFLFQPVSGNQFVTSAKVLGERGWQLVLARRASELKLSPVDRKGGELTWWPEWGTDRDTVIFWPSDTNLLNGQRFIVSEDSTVLDTLTYRSATAMPFNLTVTAGRDPVTGALLLLSSRPVAAMDTAHAELRMDSLKVPFSPIPDTIQRRTIRLDLELPAGKTASLVLYPRSIRGEMGGTNDTTRLRFGAVDPRTLGKLKVLLTADSGTVVPGPLVLQLHTAQGRVMREALLGPIPAQVAWADLPPGSYGLKLVEDRDGNGRWTTGSFIESFLPERVVLHPDPVILRAGWAVETSWKVKNRP